MDYFSPDYTCTPSFFFYVYPLYILSAVVMIIGLSQFSICIYIITNTTPLFFFDYFIGILTFSGGSLGLQVLNSYRNRCVDNKVMFRKAVLVAVSGYCIVAAIGAGVSYKFFSPHFAFFNSIQACASSTSNGDVTNCSRFGAYQCYGNAESFHTATVCQSAPPQGMNPQCGCTTSENYDTNNCYYYTDVKSGCGVLVNGVNQVSILHEIK